MEKAFIALAIRRKYSQTKYPKLRFGQLYWPSIDCPSCTARFWGFPNPCICREASWATYLEYAMSL